MRRLTLVLGIAACGGDSPTAGDPQTFEFGPYTLAAGQEIKSQCVSVTLHNEEPLYVNSVELTTGTGFHHSNWFWVPDGVFAGPDGTWPCSERNYDEASVAAAGGVLFAQSTQAQHEIQSFPEGVAIVVPAHSRILAGTHLLNSGDEPVTLSLSLKVTPIAEPTTKLAAMSFTNESISIPPRRSSRMTMECTLGNSHQTTLGRPMDFSVFYALAHYHELGTGITVEAVKADGTSAMIFETTSRIGDALGGTIDPGFSMTGYSKLKFSCNFDNPRDTTVTWGLGGGEMCTFLSFTDSARVWGGGAITRNETPTIVDQGTYIEYTYPCSIISLEPNL